MMWILTASMLFFSFAAGRATYYTLKDESLSANYKGMAILGLWVIVYVMYVWTAF